MSWFRSSQSLFPKLPPIPYHLTIKQSFCMWRRGIAHIWRRVSKCTFQGFMWESTCTTYCLHAFLERACILYKDMELSTSQCEPALGTWCIRLSLAVGGWDTAILCPYFHWMLYKLLSYNTSRVTFLSPSNRFPLGHSFCPHQWQLVRQTWNACPSSLNWDFQSTRQLQPLPTTC